MEAATSSYSATGKFWQYIYFMLVAKNHHKIRSRCLVHEFYFEIFFNDINHGYKAAFVAAFVLYGCGFLLLLWKGAQNDEHASYIIPP